MIRNVAAVKRLASEGARLDGRAMNEYRGPISIQTNVSQTAEGSARVQIGDTVVMAGVKLSLEKPYNDTPDEGGIMINVELLPLSSADYDPGPPGIKAVELARVTDRAIREAKAIDFKKLCIRSGELAWFVSVDILTINDAGNLFDAICLATLVALNQTKLRPYDENTGVVDYKGTTEEALPIIKQPLSVTVYKINNQLLVDPTCDEEEALDARLTVAADEEGVISAMQKGGDTPVTVDEVSQMVELALEKIAELRGIMEKQ